MWDTFFIAHAYDIRTIVITRKTIIITLQNTASAVLSSHNPLPVTIPLFHVLPPPSPLFIILSPYVPGFDLH
jgi:hypothetical protein